jgi:SAM-dependent methyltransferase
MLALTAPQNTNIHSNDQMSSFIAATRGNGAVAYSDYFTSGLQLLKILEQLVRWKFGSFESVDSLLDFASGYGRLTRFLVQRMEPGRIWVSDIQADAVRYQQDQFGVNGFVSTTDPADLPCDRTFDCIFVASLFSHLPGKTFTAWLKKLHTLLRPGGLLAFSVHDEHNLPTGQVMPVEGIWFGFGSEVASLDTQEYGTTFVTEAYVREAILAATGSSAYRRIPNGMLYHQDLYVVVNEPAPDFSGLNFLAYPHGSVDYALTTAQGELRLRGWAVDFASEHTGLTVQVVVDGRLLQECVPNLPRLDVREQYKDDRFLRAGWECSLPFADYDSDQPLVVKAVSDTGTESLLYVGSSAALRPRGAVDQCHWVGPGELYVRGWAADGSGADALIEVQIFVNGSLRQRCLPFMRRPDLQAHFKDDRFLHAGWECYLRVPDDDAAQVKVVRARAGNGDEDILYDGSVPTSEWHGTPDSSQPAGALLHLQTELDRRLEYIKHLEAEVARKNAALAELEARARRGRRWRGGV